MRRTSTYDPTSQTAVLGQAAEIVVRDRLQNRAKLLNLDVHVSRVMDPLAQSEAKSSGWVAIKNSQNGDVYVRDRTGHTLFSIEVKASFDWPNASITESELTTSDARYLVAITTAGLWACTMEEARRRAIRRSNFSGFFWIVPHDRVNHISVDDMLNSCPRPQCGLGPFDRW